MPKNATAWWALSREEIGAFVQGFSRGEIPDYQMAALAMAIYIRGMTADETAALTDAMLASGQRLPARPRVDKHSTGGIGDKASAGFLRRFLACRGLLVPMISGRGLGIDRWHARQARKRFPASETHNLSLAEIHAISCRARWLRHHGRAKRRPRPRPIKKLYALRDVTGPRCPAFRSITASIMS